MPLPQFRINWKPFVAAVFAIILAIKGMWSSRKRPWKNIKSGRAMLQTWIIFAFPFMAAEVATGILSFLTGKLSIPPLFGLGMAADLAILTMGILVAVCRALKSR